MAGRVKVIEESGTGRNEQFVDTRTGERMSRAEFVRRIDGGQYPNYHTRVIGGVKTPASNPDDSENNNLG